MVIGKSTHTNLRVVGVFLGKLYLEKGNTYIKRFFLKLGVVVFYNHRGGISD